MADASQSAQRLGGSYRCAVAGTSMSGSNNGHERAIKILRELHAAEEELVGQAVVMTDGKAGTINHIYLDDVHGLRISIAGHAGQWPISTVKFFQSGPAHPKSS